MTGSPRGDEKGSPVVPFRPDRRCPRNCDRRAVPSSMPLGVRSGKARRTATTREPGDLPVTVDPSRARGVPGGRGLSSRERRLKASDGRCARCRGMSRVRFPSCLQHRRRGDSRCLLPVPALAQIASSSPLASTDDDAKRDVVVTATRAEQDRSRSRPGRHRPRPATTSSAARPSSLSDLLATTPGVTVTRNGGVGGFTAVRMRGAEARPDAGGDRRRPRQRSVLARRRLRLRQSAVGQRRARSRCCAARIRCRGAARRSAASSTSSPPTPTRRRCQRPRAAPNTAMPTPALRQRRRRRAAIGPSSGR